MSGRRSRTDCGDRTGHLLRALEALGYNIAGTSILAAVDAPTAGFTGDAEAA